MSYDNLSSLSFFFFLQIFYIVLMTFVIIDMNIYMFNKMKMCIYA